MTRERTEQVKMTRNHYQAPGKTHHKSIVVTSNSSEIHTIAGWACAESCRCAGRVRIVLQSDEGGGGREARLSSSRMRRMCWHSTDSTFATAPHNASLDTGSGDESASLRAAYQD
jgi:hypothetical protein